MPAKKKKRLTLKSPPKPGTVKSSRDKKDCKRVSNNDIDFEKALSKRSKDAIKKREAILDAFMRTRLYKSTMHHFDCCWGGRFKFETCDGCATSIHLKPGLLVACHPREYGPSHCEGEEDAA